MLRLAQEAIGILEDVVFLGAEAADPFEGLHGQQGVALADFREVAAVEQLEKLNGELNITNAAVAGFCVEITGTGLGGLVLDAAFDRLDLVDLAETQILAVDERLDDRQEFLAQ